MKFKKFLKEFKEEVYKKEHNIIASEEVEKRNVDVWMIHQTIETNKKLVWATWSLAIATIILVVISLYFQYFT
ncbi:MAG: hypothetical protein IIA49_05720 [Bacteroidetes bacterium]|nr:hypothetical protein [Bacteroidota bacterium]